MDELVADVWGFLSYDGWYETQGPSPYTLRSKNKPSTSYLRSCRPSTWFQ